MVHGYSPALVSKVQKIIDRCTAGALAPNTAYEDICDILYAENLLVDVQLDVMEVMCHTANRGSLGLNGYNVHRNGAEVDRVGCDPKELNKAACFEVCPLQPMKGEQIAFNEKLIAASNGMLAPLCGRESVMSVGTGHYTAWCRAVKHGCRTPIKSLGNIDGILLADRFRKKDGRMGKCLDSGYVWRKFPWQSGIAWHELPDLCQRALNSSHGVSSRSTELEVMVTIAGLEKDRTDGVDDAKSSGGGASSKKPTFADIVDAVALSAPPCIGYIKKVGSLATIVGGGASAPMLMFLDRFAKNYGENLALGEEFVTALVDMEVSKVEKMVCTRVAMMACNLVSPKVQDGIAKLLTKSDVDKLKGKAVLEKALLTEQRLLYAWKLAHENVRSGYISEAQLDDIVGQFYVRSMLILLDKQKFGPEKVEYKDMDHVRTVFVKSLKLASGPDAWCGCGDWALHDDDDAGPPDGSNPSKTADDDPQVMLTAEEHRDPRRIFANNGSCTDNPRFLKRSASQV